MNYYQAQELIQNARKLLKPSEVRHDHVPNWFRLALVQMLKNKGVSLRHEPLSGWNVVGLALRGATWLDHWGSTKLTDGRIAFVSEPYGVSLKELNHISDVARAIGCECWVSANSWWYPGHTMRVVFAEEVDRPSEN